MDFFVRYKWFWASILFTISNVFLLAAVMVPEQFARLGSFVIFLAILAFGLQKYRDRKPGSPIIGSRPVEMFELTLVAVGTLQWGYGDLWADWLQMKGQY